MVSTRRRTQRGKTEKYDVGDKVEVVRVGGIDVGILLSKDDDEARGTGDVTHWIVSVDGSHDEEVISEKALGRVLESHESDEASATIEKTKKPVAKKTQKAKPKAKVVVTSSKGSRRMNTRAASKNGKDGALTNGLDFERRPVPRPKKKQGDETVIEVEMLTGTLFIYRGTHHRVEFIRTI